MNKKCGICGKPGADILCTKCGTIVCERCYDSETDACIKCSGKLKGIESGPKRMLYLVVGALLILMGLFVASFAFIPLTGATIVVFPLVFENVNSVTALLMSLLYFGMYALVSLVPLYLLFRRDDYDSWDEGLYTIQESSGSGSNVTETIEYIITTEVPEKLRDSIYIEDNLDEVVIRSEKDTTFQRHYNIPDNYLIDYVESAYEDGYLLLRVKLVKS